MIITRPCARSSVTRCTLTPALSVMIWFGAGNAASSFEAQQLPLSICTPSLVHCVMTA